MQFIQSLRKVSHQLEFLAPVVVPILAVSAALAVGALFLLVLNVNPGTVYTQLVRGAVGSSYSIAQTLGKATPLLLVAIGICIAFRANVLNIGAEGQVIIGGIATAAFALAFPDLPAWLMVILSIAAGFLGGAVWGGIAGALKAWFGVNEILSTIMMNQIALRVLLLLLTGPMRDPTAAATSANIVQTAEIPKSAFLPTLYPQSSLHTGALLAIALAFVVYFFLWRTVAGYRIRATGANPDAARYAGIHVRRTTVLAIALSGGLAGIAGSVEVLGVTHRALQDFTTGYGFSGIVVALFGLLHPVGAIPAAALFGGLLSSSTTLQSAGISSAMVTVLQGLVVIFVVGSQQWTQRARHVREQEKKPEKVDVGKDKGLTNIFAYEARAEEGGCVFGTMAALMTKSNVLGIVGPVNAGDAKLYIDGFKDCAEKAKAGVEVKIIFTESFGDIPKATEAVKTLISQKADILTGSAQQVPGAITETQKAGLKWFSTDVDQAPKWPDTIVASMVYDWTAMLKDMIALRAGGTEGGKAYEISFANGSLKIVWNDKVEVPADVKKAGEDIMAKIKDGSLHVVGSPMMAATMAPTAAK